MNSYLNFDNLAQLSDIPPGPERRADPSAFLTTICFVIIIIQHVRGSEGVSVYFLILSLNGGTEIYLGALCSFLRMKCKGCISASPLRLDWKDLRKCLVKAGINLSWLNTSARLSSPLWQKHLAEVDSKGSFQLKVGKLDLFPARTD